MFKLMDVDEDRHFSRDDLEELDKDRVSIDRRGILHNSEMMVL